MFTSARLLLTVFLGLLPASTRKNRLLGRANRKWQISDSASIRSSLFWRVGELHLEHGSRIGPFNIFRDLALVHLEDEASIGQLNWFSAAARIAMTERAATSRSLKIEAKAALTSRHYLDCSGGFVLGPSSTFAGVRSTVITHGPDLITSKMMVAPVVIGSFCFVGSNTVFVQGCSVADRIMIAAGSVVSRDLTEPQTLYAGVPAAARRTLPSDAQYFTRAGRLIDPESKRHQR